jgi:hypothetical protein
MKSYEKNAWQGPVGLVCNECGINEGVQNKEKEK